MACKYSENPWKLAPSSKRSARANSQECSKLASLRTHFSIGKNMKSVLSRSPSIGSLPPHFPADSFVYLVSVCCDRCVISPWNKKLHWHFQIPDNRRIKFTYIFHREIKVCNKYNQPHFYRNQRFFLIDCKNNVWLTQGKRDENDFVAMIKSFEYLSRFYFENEHLGV